MGVSFAYNTNDKHNKERETMRIEKCEANSKHSRNTIKSPKVGNVVLERNPSFKTLVDDDNLRNSPTKTLRDENHGPRSRKSLTLKGPKPENVILERSPSFKTLVEHISTRRSPPAKTFKGENHGPKPKKSVNLKGPKPENVILERSLSFRSLVQAEEHRGISSPKCPTRGNLGITEKLTELSFPVTAPFTSPRPVTELEAAAVKLQKVYKSYRTRRNLADCAVVVEELWWKLEQSSASFSTDDKPETAISRWARAGTKAAKVGKGLCKNDKAQNLALRHWLEAIDPRHRYGHNLNLYYDVWFGSKSCQPFFFWLDIGEGREINLEKCPRTLLQRQCVTYLGPKERRAYEVVVEEGKLIYRQSREVVKTEEGSKWIFVLSTTRTLYVGQKKKGLFQHSSFLSGAAITAAGRIVTDNGTLKAVWPYSGHYLPTEENFREFIRFLEENNVDITAVKLCAVDDDNYLANGDERSESKEQAKSDGQDECKVISVDPTVEESRQQQGLSCTWTTGAGPRIGCVREYPMELQTRALEQVNLSPRVVNGPSDLLGLLPSPRPRTNIRLSPRLACMGLPSPRN